MQDIVKGPIHNTLPGAKVQFAHEIGAGRCRHVGEMVLANFNEEVLSPVDFARNATQFKPTHSQGHILNAASKNSRLLVLSSPGVGSTVAGALFALHRVTSRRDHRVFVISPTPRLVDVCKLQFRSNSLRMLDADILFRIRTESGFWADERYKWGVHWNSLNELPVKHIADVLRYENTIIVDDAHQYTPEFLLLLQAAIKPHQQLILIGKDVNTALARLEADPDFTTVRVRIDQSPLATAGYINNARARYQEYPEVYEQIYQMPISWEPVKCPA